MWVSRHGGIYGSFESERDVPSAVLALEGYVLRTLAHEEEATDRLRASAQFPSLGADYAEPSVKTAIDAFEHRIWVEWSARAYLGRLPTGAERTGCSKALSALERRGLIELHDSTGGEGTKRRTDRVRLTRAGSAAVGAILRAETGTSRRFDLRPLDHNPTPPEPMVRCVFLRSQTLLEAGKSRHYRRGAAAAIETSTAQHLAAFGVVRIADLAVSELESL